MKLSERSEPSGASRTAKNGAAISSAPSGNRSLVIVASSDPRIRRQWAGGLSGFSIQSARDLGELRAVIGLRKPGVVLLDCALAHPPARVVEDLVRLDPSARIVFFTPVPQAIEAASILRAGARGYYQLDIDPLLLSKAVSAVSKGELWVSREILTDVLYDHLQRPEQPASSVTPASSGGHPPGLLAMLSPRERQIAELIGTGASNKEIAADLHVCEATVKAHLTTVFRKLRIRDRLRLGLMFTHEDASTI